MQRTPPQSRWKRFIRAKPILALGGTILVLVMVMFAKEFERRLDVNREIQRLQGRVQELEDRRTNLSNLIQFFQSPLYQEQEAREKLGLAKPGESVVVVPLPGESQAGGIKTPEDALQTPRMPNPQKWWEYFFPERTM